MQRFSIALGQNGQVVIPASVRKSLGLEQGQYLSLHFENQRIVLKKTNDVIQELQNRFSGIKQSLSEELIQERRKGAS